MRLKPNSATIPSTPTRASVARGDIVGAAGPQGGVLAQSGSAQSVSPLPLLSIPSLHAAAPAVSSCGGVGVGVGVPVAVTVGEGCSGVCVGVAVGVLVGVIVGVLVDVAVAVVVGVTVAVLTDTTTSFDIAISVLGSLVQFVSSVQQSGHPPQPQGGMLGIQGEVPDEALHVAVFVVLAVMVCVTSTYAKCEGSLGAAGLQGPGAIFPCRSNDPPTVVPPSFLMEAVKSPNCVSISEFVEKVIGVSAAEPCELVTT